MTALVAGTQFRGQFESRDARGCIDEVKKRRERHPLSSTRSTILVGAGDAEGVDERGQHLKAGALARARFRSSARPRFDRVPQAHRKGRGAGAALPAGHRSTSRRSNRRCEILKGIKKYYESYHGVKVSDELIRRTVVLSERYITDRYLPDKAIDLYGRGLSSYMRDASSPLIDEYQHAVSRELTPSQARTEESAIELQENRNRGGLPPARRA